MTARQSWLRLSEAFAAVAREDERIALFLDYENLAIGAREHQKGKGWGGYPYSELAMQHDASAPEETTDAKVAYARFPESQPGEFREDWLP